MKPEVGPFDENAVEDDSIDQESTDDNVQEKAADLSNPNPAADIAEAKEAPKREFKCEVKEYEARYNLQGKRIIKEAGSKGDVDEMPKDEPQFAMKSYKHYSQGGSLEGITIEVHSPHIKEALRVVIKSYPGQNFSGSIIYLSGPTISAAMSCLFHHRRELEAYGKKQGDLEAKMHVLFAVKFVEKELRRAVQRHETQVTQSETPGIEYGDLWIIFKPGELVFTGSSHSERILQVIGIEYVMSQGFFAGPEHWAVTAQSFSHNGNSFGYVHEIFKISPYGGTEEIVKLPIYPLEYHFSQDAQRAKQIVRGKKFCTLTGVQYRFYKGTAWAVGHERIPGLFGMIDEYPQEAIEASKEAP